MSALAGPDREVFAMTSLLVVAGIRDVCIVMARAEAPVPLVRAIRTEMIAFAEKRRNGFALLFLVEEKSKAPDGDARAAAAEMFKAVSDELRIVGALLEGSGFAAAVKRSVFTWATGNLFGKANVKTFAHLTESCAWIVDRCGDIGLASPSAKQLEDFVLELKATPV